MCQKDFTLFSCKQRASLLGVALQSVGKRYLNRHCTKSGFGSTSSILFIASMYATEQQQVRFMLNRANRIAATDFLFNFNRVRDREALEQFRFRVSDMMHLVPVFAWPVAKNHTSRNRYRVSSILAAFILLRRMAVPDRWADLEDLFGKHSSQLSEIFWEAIENLVRDKGNFLLDPIPQTYMKERAERFATFIHAKGAALHKCVGFIYGTVVGVARPKGYMQQMVVYNGRKRSMRLSTKPLQHQTE